MELENLFGLPAHPLVVHAAVVLLPLAAIGTIVVAVLPRARRHYAPVVFAVALLATVGIGWISVPKGPTIHNVRLRAYEMGGGSGIRVTGLGAVEIEAPEIANTVDTKLVSLEREILRRRCLLGLDMPASALLSVDDGALAARAHEIGMRARAAPVA